MNRLVIYSVAALAAGGVYFAIMSVPNMGSSGTAGGGSYVASEQFKPELRGRTALEQAIRDGFDEEIRNKPAAREHWLNAMAYIGITLTEAGHRCVVPFSSQQVADGVWKIGCETNRDGTSRATYRVNALSGEITQI